MARKLTPSTRPRSAVPGEALHEASRNSCYIVTAQPVTKGEALHEASRNPSAQESPLRVASRASTLALLQVREFFRAFPGLQYEIISQPAWGDRRKDISLLDNPPADLFTREQDELVLQGKADIAIHSAKDMPFPLPEGLELLALTEAFDATDSLVSTGNKTLNELPAGARVATSSPTRKAELLALRPDLEVAGIRGTIEERIAQIDAGEYDALIVASCALQRLGLTHRIAEVLPFRTHPLQGCLAVVGKKGNRLAVSTKTEQSAEENLPTSEVDFTSVDARTRYGHVSITGFGPGNPDLLTRRATRALEQADCIFYDDLLDARELHRYTADKVYVGKRKDQHSHSQEEIHQLLMDAARAGRRVVRLKGGDPMVFAHGGEEALALAQCYIPFEIIPGISTALAVASLTGIPLTHRGLASSVAFVTGHSSGLKLPDTDTVVIYMGAANLRPIAANALAQGRDPETPVLLAAHVSRDNEQRFFSTLKELASEEKSYPTPLIVVVGKVASLGAVLPAKSRPTLLVTGTHPGDYDRLGKVIHQPLIELKALHTPPLRELLPDHDWLIFTSRNSVDFFFQALLKEEKTDIRSLARLRIVSVGRITSSALLRYGLKPDLQATDESSEGILKLLLHHPAARAFIPRSAIGLPTLPEGLRNAGWKVSEIPLYTNSLPEATKPIDLAGIDTIVLTSPSCVSNFKQVYGQLPADKEYLLRGRETENRFDREKDSTKTYQVKLQTSGSTHTAAASGSTHHQHTSK